MREANINWRTYLLEIIDGKYALDIQKIGDSSSFIKNQIESFELVNVEYDNFRNSLKELIYDTSFLNSSIVDNVEKYLFIVDWGIKFILDNKYFLKKLISIQFNFSEHDFSQITDEGVKKIETLLIKANLGIVQFIENWSKQNIVYKNESLFDKIEYLEALKTLWEIRISAPQKLNDINILKGLIYLDFWAAIKLEKRKQFFIINKGNVQLFSVIIFDLKRLEKNRRINYFSFVDDIKQYYSEFIEVIQSNCPSWLNDNEKMKPISKEVMVGTSINSIESKQEILMDNLLISLLTSQSTIYAKLN